MGGIHDTVMKFDPLSKKVAGKAASTLGIEEDVEGDVLGLSNEAKEVRQKKADEAVRASKKQLTIPVGSIKKVN